MNNWNAHGPLTRRSAALSYISSKLGRAALAAAALALVSCWHPAFDPEISGSEAVIRKLGAPILWFTMEGVRADENDELLFLPNAVNPPTLGLLLRLNSQRVVVSALEFNSITHTGLYSSNSRDYPRGLGGQITVLPSPSGLGPDAFLATNIQEGIYVHSMASPLDTSSANLEIINFPSLPGAAWPPTFGIGAVAKPLDTMIRFSWIGYESGAVLRFYRDLWNGGSAPGLGPVTDIELPDKDLIDIPGKVLELESGHIFLSCGLIDGSRAIYRWNGPSDPFPVRFSEVYGPIVAALSDSRLIAEKDGILTVLDRDLKSLFSFPSGKLSFIYERWDGTRMISVFTRAVYVRTERGDDIGRLKVEVYEIPTADLHKLAD